MALNGTLSDMGIVDLIQFPSTGRKTGALLITTSDQQEARLYYVQGKLEHVVARDLVGMDALCELVCWEEGHFEFQQDVEAEEQSLNMDLHRALMQALKLRDERAEARRQKNSAPTETDSEIEQIQKALETFVENTANLQGAYLFSQEGTCLAQAIGEKGPPQQIDTLASLLTQLIDAFERPGFKRALLEDELGTVVAVQLKDKSISMLVAGREVPLGVVSMNANRLATVIEGYKS